MSYNIRNEEIELILRDIGKRIGASIPPGWGFNLQIFEFEPGDALFYISNANREDIVKVMKEFIARNTQ